MKAVGKTFIVLGCTLSLAAAGLNNTPTQPAAQTPLWSLTPLQKPAVPAGEANPLDAFIRDKLRQHGLSPSTAATPRALIRRLSYDLTGLPPQPEEIASFESDPSFQAYQVLVDRWLASPRYGEQWARHWLDVANYADTHGNDHDYARPQAWPYRDYVIQSLNADKPYDRFVQEQVAGDVLFPNDPAATVALGFVAAGPWDHTLMVTVREDTVDHQMAQYLDRDNMVSTVIGTFQSLTIHCARCHDHKFDPITQHEYYSLQAVFAGVDRANRPFDPDNGIHASRQRLLAEQRSLKRRDASALAAIRTPETQSKLVEWAAQQSRREKAWTPLRLENAISTGGASLTRQPDDSWLASGKRPDRDTYILTTRTPARRPRALRLQVLPDDSLPQRGPGRWDNGNLHLSEVKAFVSVPNSGEAARPIVFSKAVSDYDEGPTISITQAIDGKNETHWGVHPRYGQAHEAVFEIKDPTLLVDGSLLTVLLEHQGGTPGHGIGRFRLSLSDESPSTASLSPLAAEWTALLAMPPAQRTPQQTQDLALFFLQRENDTALAALPTPQSVYAITQDFPPDGNNFKPAIHPRPVHVLARGELSKPGVRVHPGTLSCVPELSPDLSVSENAEESARRAALARWLVDDRNVLTWRSIVNRVWSWHFGRGLRDTPNDFGRMGGSPSHPELLDWLAVWFRDEAQGSLKALHRLILTSETWRQSTLADHGSSLDADNRLLWRQNRTRLSAEQVRDTVLDLAGRLDLTMGGPAAVQFVSRGDATFMSGGNPAFLDYEHFDPDAGASRRRAIYRFLFRTVPDPLMDALDCPDGSTATPVRSASSTAQQAFALLNDPFLIRQSEHIAHRLGHSSKAPDQQAEAAFRAILLRQPSEPERRRFAGYVRQHGLANACQLLLNSNEFLFLD
jgi:hypothetical protein